ncbi:MAG: hypothetical protein L6R42_002053 [Xanthoria sp. 1 TBL-2021]|nr:MAG: hypothetical protein L6R42_002053 [Xanthoria sp. 1 TBL-2021]
MQQASETLVVGRELRGLDMQQMRGTDFRYVMKVHSHFTTARKIGASKLKIKMSDSSGSSLLIHGPYASTVEAAIAALESDLVSKLRYISAEPGKAAHRGWFSKAPTQGIGGGPPGLRCTTGPGFNVKVVAPDVANKEAAEAEEKGLGALGST